MSDTIEKQQEAKQLVKELMQEDQRTRNSDLWLTLRMWQKKQYIKLYVPFDELSRMIMPETISRCRRQIQNTEGQLLPTEPQVLVKRRVKEELLRKFYAEKPDIINKFEELKYGVK